MDIEIDPLSPVPIYQQIRDRIVEAIGAGALRRGDGLTSVRALASAFAINPATVSKAYDLLRSEGLVGTNAKSGTFVLRDSTSGPPPAGFPDEWNRRLHTLLAEARAHGLTPDEVTAATAHQLRSLADGSGAQPNDFQETR